MTPSASFLRYTNLLIMLLFLFSCATPQSINQQGKERTIDMGNYTVDLPPGENWNVKIDRGTDRVRFLKQPKSLFGGGGLPTTMIQVSYNWVTQEKMWQWSEDEIANDYINGEINNSMTAGVFPGSYELHDVKKDVTIIDEKKLYTLSYKQMGGEWYSTDKISESILYMYFPSNFKEKHMFYLLIITELNKRDRQATTDLTSILPVIRSLQPK